MGFSKLRSILFDSKGLLALYLLGLFWWSRDLALLPGLHADEAWVFLRTDFSEGSGMNAYTSGLYGTSLNLFFGLFGKGIFQLRLFGLLLNFVALGFALALLRRLYVEKELLLAFSVLTLSSPAFGIFSRMAFELTALLPLFLWAGAFCIVSGWQQKTSRALVQLLVGGFLFGLAAHTHLLALSVVVSLFVACLSVYRRAIFVRSLGFCLLGFVGGFLQRLLALFGSKESGAVVDVVVGQWGDVVFYQDLLALPFVLGEVLDGTLLYLRTTGGIILPVLPVAALLLFLGFWLLWKNRQDITFSRSDAVLVLTFLLLPLSMRCLAGNTSLRYFVFSAQLFPIILLLVFRGAGAFRAGFPMRRALFFGVGLCVMMQVATVETNYFMGHRETGGGHRLFSLGAVLRETSSHFVDTKSLYNELRQAGVRKVSSNYFIAESLKALDWKNQSLEVSEQEMYRQPGGGKSEEEATTYYIYYNTPMPGWPAWEELNREEVIRLGHLTLQRLPLPSSHFLVFAPVPEVSDE